MKYPSFSKLLQGCLCLAPILDHQPITGLVMERGKVHFTAVSLFVKCFVILVLR